MPNNRSNNSWFCLKTYYLTSLQIRKMENSKTTYWQNAERTNGRMAMMGLFALVVNYGLFGWIIPGIF
ncbi:chlorophyll a/b-binding protein [Prochlorococcus marinus]